MKEAAFVLDGNIKGVASVPVAHLSASPVGTAAPANPRYCTYVVGYVSVASPTIQVMSPRLEYVFEAFRLLPPPTISVAVSVMDT